MTSTLGATPFGQFANNRYNFNAAYFYLLEKTPIAN
jgi:hypothetical protein